MKRSRTLAVVVLLSLIVMTGCSPAAILSPAVAAAPNRAVMYRGGPQRTGIYDTKGVAKLSGVKWQFQTGGPVWSSPVVANGVVYFGSDDGHLYAVDAQTGQEKWRFKTGDDVRSSPAIANGVAYVVSYDGNLYAVNIQTGQQVWKFTLFGDDIAKLRPSYDDYLSSPAVANGIVYVGSPDPRHGFYAIDAQAGQEKWSFKKQEGMIDMVRSSPAVSGNTVYFGGDFDSFHALDANTGQPKWTFKAAGTLNYAPAVGEDGTVYFSSKDTNLYAVNGQTGELKWKAHLSGMSWVTSSPAVLKDTVYAGTSDGCTLFALDVKTGQVKWKFPAHGYVWSSPSFAEGIVYVGSSGGRVYAVDAKTGQELWNFKTKGSVYSTPVVADGVVYIGSTDGTLYALQ